MDISRRSALAAGGSLLALSLGANADEGNKDGDTLYGHGMVWNRDLPGVLGELRLSFDMRINLEGHGIWYGRRPRASGLQHPLLHRFGAKGEATKRRSSVHDEGRRNRSHQSSECRPPRGDHRGDGRRYHGHRDQDRRQRVRWRRTRRHRDHRDFLIGLLLPAVQTVR